MADVIGVLVEEDDGEVCAMCADEFVGAAAWCAPDQQMVGAFGSRFKSWWKKLTHKEGKKSALRTYAKTAVKTVVASGVLGPVAAVALNALSSDMDDESEAQGDDSVAVITDVPRDEEEAATLLERASAAWEEGTRAE